MKYILWQKCAIDVNEIGTQIWKWLRTEEIKYLKKNTF